MELNWLECFLYGLISGLTEFLPVSALAHQTIFLKLLGHENPIFLQLSAHIGTFAALLVSCFSVLKKMRREWRLYSLPPKRRRRHPDHGILTEIRVFRTAGAFVMLLFLGYNLVRGLHERLWILAILLGINGILLYLPQYLPGANKGAQSLSRLDAVLIGIASGCGIIPGISAVGSAISVSRIRGCDRGYAAELALLLCIPGLFVLLILELFAAFTVNTAMTGILILYCITVTATSFFSAYWGMILMRFLAVKVGYSGFAYYCWGLALFTLILYLI